MTDTISDVLIPDSITNWHSLLQHLRVSQIQRNEHKDALILLKRVVSTHLFGWFSLGVLHSHAQCHPLIKCILQTASEQPVELLCLCSLPGSWIK